MISVPRRAAALIVFLAALTSIAIAQTVVPIAINGDPANRVDLVVLGDGYTSAEMSKFAFDANTFITGMMAQEPYREYQGYFNVRRIEVASAQSGASHPESGIVKNTALGAYYNCENIQRLICLDANKVLTVLSAVPLDQRDLILVLVNDAEYGGAGGEFAVASLAPQSVEIVLHELGHSFGWLADEYGGPPPPACEDTYEPPAPNVTKETDRFNIKWRTWLDAATPVPTTTTQDGVPGLYVGAEYCDTTLFRSTSNSKMRSLGQPYWQINVEQLVKQIYTYVDPIDTHTPVILDAGPAQTFSVTIPAPATHSFDIGWWLDDVLQPAQSSPPQLQFSLAAGSLTPGLHTLKVVVADRTPMVASDPKGLLLGSVTWNLSNNKQAPIISWSAPVPITYGTALSATQLNATASVPGMFVYNPAAGTVLEPGVQTLSATFTPTDTTDYATTTAMVPLTVNSPAPVLSALSPSSATAGGAAFTLTLNGSNFINGSVVRWNGTSRPTAYVSSTRLTADIPASDIATAASSSVTAFNPPPGGGASGAQTFTTNVVVPAPVITSLSPVIAMAAASGFTLVIAGNNFGPGVTALWNGSARSTTWVSATQLTASIPAADVAAVGTADIVVANPASLGGGVSSKFEFVIDSAANVAGSFTVSSTTTTLNVQHGQSTTLPVTFTGIASGATTKATCLNLPAGASCSYINGVVTITTSSNTPTGSYLATVIFTVTQTTRAMARGGQIYLATSFGLTALPLGLLWMCGGRKRALRHWWIPLFGLFLMLLLAGCGGGSSSTPSTPTTTATTQSSMSLVLIVR